MMRFLASLLLSLLVAQASYAGLIIRGGSVPIPTAPTGILLGGNAPPGSATIVDNATAGTGVGTLSAVGGTAPYTYVDTDNTKFQISGAALQRSSTGTLTSGVGENVDIQVTDANNLTYTTSAPFIISVTAHTGTLLTTLTLTNPTGSTQSTNFVTQIFGHAFKKGDIANGCTTGAPQFQLAVGGTTIPFSESVHPACWSDGSLKHAAFMFRVPTAISANSSVTVNVYNGGTVPSNSSRALSDFAAGGLDLNEQVVGLDNLSGTWTADLNQGISANGADYKYMDGDAGAVWRVRAAYRQSSADHGQLEDWWYVQALQNNSGGLYGIRYLAGTTQPYYNVASPSPVYRAFTSVGIYNGASLVRDLWGTHGNSQSFVWDPTIQAYCGNKACGFTATANGLESGFLLRLFTTGTLPSNLSTGTTYFAGHNGPDANHFAIGTDSNSVSQGIGYIVPTNNGSGTHTVQAYPYVTQFGTMYSAESNGQYSYIQGAGTVAADTSVRVIVSNTYLRSTHLILSYAFGTYSPASNSSCSYFIMTACFITRYFEQTGERDDIGPTSAYATRYLFTGAAVDEQVVRNIALIGANLPVKFRDATTKSVPNLTNSSRSGMPSSTATTMRWYGNPVATAGFTAPSNSAVWVAGFSTPDSSHLPDFTGTAYLMFAEPQMMDQVADFGSLAVLFRSQGIGVASVGAVTTIGGAGGASRNFTISGTTYYGATLNYGNTLRTDAWSIRDVSAAAGLLPNTNPENAAYWQYFNDLLQATFDAEAAYFPLLPTYPVTNGLWNETDSAAGGTNDEWTTSYMRHALGLAYGRTEKAGALAFLNLELGWPTHIHNVWGTAYIPHYESMIRQANNSHSAPFMTSDALGAFYDDATLSWNSGTGLFTISNLPPGTTWSNGDLIIFNEQDQTVPGNFSGETPYYVKNLSGLTFNLATSPGGTVVTPSTTSSNGHTYLYSSSLVAPNNITSNTTGSGYLASITSSFLFAKSLNATVDATTQADLVADLAAQSGYVAAFNTTPTYATQATP